MREWVISSVLECLFNIFIEVGQNLDQFGCLLMSFKHVSLTAVLQRLEDLKQHENADIAFMSSAITKYLPFCAVSF